MRGCRAFLCLLLALCGGTARGERVEFRADFYTRDLGKNTTSARGNAWVRKGDKQIWADELEIDFNRDLVVARGTVHVKDGSTDIYCDEAVYNMDGEDGVLENAVLSTGQVVLTGSVVERKNRTRYEITDGTYTNCNMELKKGREIADCTYDWRVYGKRLSVTLESYVHVQDAIVHAAGFPILYLPYLILPAKTERQTGLLVPRFSYRQNLGTGITQPFFWDMADWMDMTVEPTYFTKKGLKLGLLHRYVYDENTRGTANVFFLQRRFSPNRDNPEPDDVSRSRTLGLFGEAAVDIRNTFPIGKRAYSRQVIRWVSDPYYMYDYSADFASHSGLPSLRSQLFVTVPGENQLFTVEAQHHQSLIISDDSGVDRGAVTKLPSVSYSMISTPILSNLFSYELVSNFTNFARPAGAFDAVPAAINTGDKVHSDPDPNFGPGDYLRTGQRLLVEPRLVINTPVPEGFQFQPILRAGAIFYHFELPASRMIHREYASLELPASIYASRTFSTGIRGYERVRHVLQPRIVYANNFLKTGNDESDHPFFYNDDVRGLSNPRFDLIDELPDFEYMRFELINRFLRKTDSGVQRFFLLQLSEQYNMDVIPSDPRFSRKFGPIEILAELAFWRFSGQLQGRYQLETTQTPLGEFIRENEWSASLAYHDPSGDYVSIGSRFTKRADDSLTEETMLLGFYKYLPILFDLDGNVEYSFKRSNLVRYRVGFHFGVRERSCWQLSLNLGQNEQRRPFAHLQFRLGLDPMATLQ